MSPLTGDERARAAEMLRYPERYDDRTARELADKLEAEPEGVEVLYVVTEGLPGPEPTDATFVELETADGGSVGRASGVDWGPHPTAEGLHRLGPFVSAREAEPDVDEHVRQVNEATRTALVDRDRALDGRDEAREALRDLLDELPRDWSGMSPMAHERVQRARETVKGGERTHRLVPNEALAGNVALLDQVRRGVHTEEVYEALGDWMNACEAAARGERVEWPA